VNSRYLGLDVGERRIGVAVSDPEGRLAVPLRIVDGSNEAAAIDEIARIAREEGATTIVVGHPLSLDGTAGAQAHRVESFAGRLRKHTGLPVELWDERLTSVQVRRTAPAGRRRKKGRPAPMDDLAAAAILQSYLDSRRASAPAGTG